MAIAGPFVAFGIYKLCGKLKVNRYVSVFLAATLGDLFTYCVTSLQLALAYPAEQGGVALSAAKFLGVFAPTQLPLAIIEGLLTTVIIIALESYVSDLQRRQNKMDKNKKMIVTVLLVIACLIAIIPLFALKGAEFGGSDDAGSQMVAEIRGEEYEPWFTPVMETLIQGELPGEVESLLFCIQTGIGVGIMAFVMGRFVERKKWMTKKENK